MGSDDFISLESSSLNNNNDDGNGEIKGAESRNTETDSPTREFHVKEDPHGLNNSEAFPSHVEGQDDPTVLDMDVEDDMPHQPPALYERAEIFGSSMVKQLKVGSLQFEHEIADCTQSNGTSKKLLTDQSSATGVKRARATYEKQPSVRVTFSSLTRESKRKLMELMQQWSKWQAEHQLSSREIEGVLFEDGEETYFPALHVGSKRSNIVSFWVDNQARKEVDKGKAQFEAEVPLYDREFTLGSTSLDGSGGLEGTGTLGASRCFNCGSYSHALKQCPRPRDNIAISNARKMHNSRRIPTASNRVQARYYQRTPGKFDNLRAGVLGAETRGCLGIGEFDPPPWLHRMRELGYPPGYIDEVEDEHQPSGITIYAEEVKVVKEEEYEDGEIPEQSEPEPPEKKMTIEFPGLNAPIPENADHKRWAAPPAGSSSMSHRSRIHHRSNHSSDHHRGNYQEDRWPSDLRDDGGAADAEHGFASPYPGYSPRYSPYGGGHPGRSQSDRWWSPLPYDSPPAGSPHSPYSYGSSQQSPRDSYYKSHDHCSESSYGRMTDSQRSLERHEHHLRHHHHHHRR